MDNIIERMNRRGISTSSIQVFNCFPHLNFHHHLLAQTGVYKVRGDGDATSPPTLRHFPATVVFLDDSSHRFTLDKKAKGQDLLSLVFQHLELTEREYFGLVFGEGGVVLPAGHAPDTARWLDPAKPVRKQMRVKGCTPVTLHFRWNPRKLSHWNHFFIAMFQGEVLRDRPVSVAGGVHPVPRLPAGGEPHSDPTWEEFSNVVPQVKRDLATGRLIAPISTVCLLASYAVQSTLGDHDPDSCRSGYLEPFQVKHLTISCLSSRL